MPPGLQYLVAVFGYIDQTPDLTPNCRHFCRNERGLRMEPSRTRGSDCDKDYYFQFFKLNLKTKIT